MRDQLILARTGDWAQHRALIRGVEAAHEAGEFDDEEPELYVLSKAATEKQKSVWESFRVFETVPVAHSEGTVPTPKAPQRSPVDEMVLQTLVGAATRAHKWADPLEAQRFAEVGRSVDGVQVVKNQKVFAYRNR